MSKRVRKCRCPKCGEFLDRRTMETARTILSQHDGRSRAGGAGATLGGGARKAIREDPPVRRWAVQYPGGQVEGLSLHGALELAQAMREDDFETEVVPC